MLVPGGSRGNEALTEKSEIRNPKLKRASYSENQIRGKARPLPGPIPRREFPELCPRLGFLNHGTSGRFYLSSRRRREERVGERRNFITPLSGSLPARASRGEREQ